MTPILIMPTLEIMNMNKNKELTNSLIHRNADTLRVYQNNSLQRAGTVRNTQRILSPDTRYWSCVVADISGSGENGRLILSRLLFALCQNCDEMD